MKISSIIVPGIGAFALLTFSSCSSTDGDGYTESALPMSEVADGEIPPWLLEDDGTQQVGAGTHTPAVASRNDYSIPEPTDTKTGGGASQNHPKLAEAGQDDTIVETPKSVDVDPLATTAPADTKAVVTTSRKIASSGTKSSGAKGGKKAGKKPKRPTMIVYKVRPGDNLTLIAKRSNTTVAQIRKDSNIKGSTIYPGQTIKVRYTPKGYKPEKDDRKSGSSRKNSGTKSASTKTHKVAPGQTLSGIAAKYGVSTSALMKANGISKDDADKIRAGRRLTIPSKR